MAAVVVVGVRCDDSNDFHFANQNNNNAMQ